MLYYYIRMAKLAITKHCMKLNQVRYLVPDDQDVDYVSESEDEINTDDEDDTGTKKGKNVRGVTDNTSDMKLGECIQYF